MSRAVVSLSRSDSWDTTMQTPTCVYTAVQQYCYACSTPVRSWTMYVVSHQSGYTQLYPSDFFHSNYCSRLSLSVFWTVTIVKPTYANIKIGISNSYGFRLKQMFSYLFICESSVKTLITTAGDRFTKTGERFPWLRSVHHIIRSWRSPPEVREPRLFGGNGCSREWHFPYQGCYHGRGLEWKQVEEVRAR